MLKQTKKSLSKFERLLLIQINKPRRFTLKTPIVLMVFCILMRLNREVQAKKKTLLDFSHRCHILLTERRTQAKKDPFCMFLFSKFEFAYFIIIHNKVHIALHLTSKDHKVRNYFAFTHPNINEILILSTCSSQHPPKK